MALGHMCKMVLTTLKKLQILVQLKYIKPCYKNGVSTRVGFYKEYSQLPDPFEKNVRILIVDVIVDCIKNNNQFTPIQRTKILVELKVPTIGPHTLLVVHGKRP
jgi:hypothetical protein